MYDLREIKSIPCSEVAEKYGISLKQKHGRLWGKLREGEKTSSFNINIEKNLWVDYGDANKGGSVIDLVAEIEGISSTEAINKLAKDYGFENEKTTGWRPLTDNQYRKIGIEPTRATLNFGYDLNKHTPEQLHRWNNKYGIPVKELAEKFPTVYNKMLMKVAVEQINLLKDAYNARLNMFHDPTYNKEEKMLIKSLCETDAENINQRIKLLQIAVKTVNKKLFFNKLLHLKVNFKRDFEFKEKQNSKKNILTEDEKLRDRMIKIYKKLFNIDINFTVKQARALQDINRVVTCSDNKFLTIMHIKETYDVLGHNLDGLIKDYKEIVKKSNSINKDNKEEYNKWKQKEENLQNEIKDIKLLFTKCNIVIEGIREANLNRKNISKQDSLNKSQNKNIELIQ